MMMMRRRRRSNDQYWRDEQTSCPLYSFLWSTFSSILANASNIACYSWVPLYIIKKSNRRRADEACGLRLQTYHNFSRSWIRTANKASNWLTDQWSSINQHIASQHLKPRSKKTLVVALETKTKKVKKKKNREETKEASCFKHSNNEQRHLSSTLPWRASDGQWHIMCRLKTEALEGEWRLDSSVNSLKDFIY